MRAKPHAAATMNAYMGHSGNIQKHGVYRACLCTVSAPDTRIPFYLHPSPLALAECAGRTDLHTGCRITCKAINRLESRGKAAGAVNPDTRVIPGRILVDKARTGQGTDMTTYAAFDLCGSKYFHDKYPLLVSKDGK